MSIVLVPTTLPSSLFNSTRTLSGKRFRIFDVVSVLPKPLLDAVLTLKLVWYYQKRNFVAYLSHRKTRLAALSNIAL